MSSVRYRLRDVYWPRMITLAAFRISVVTNVAGKGDAAISYLRLGGSAVSLCFLSWSESAGGGGPNASDRSRRPARQRRCLRPDYSDTRSAVVRPSQRLRDHCYCPPYASRMMLLFVWAANADVRPSACCAHGGCLYGRRRADITG